MHNPTVVIEKGPIEILCGEIGFPFHRSLEQPRLLVLFVEQLIEQIENECGIQANIATVLGTPKPSTEARRLLNFVKGMLMMRGSADMVREAAELHLLTDQPDDGPCDHFIDMLASCISAIRFGLEIPCRSGHAATAATHVWTRLYRPAREDENTRRWAKEWARDKFQAAIWRRMEETRHG